MSEMMIPGGRTPLSGTFTLQFPDASGELYDREVTILELVGTGGSAMCYDVDVKIDESTHQRMILKQFYPDPTTHGAQVTLEGTTVTIDGFEDRPDLQELAEGFRSAYELQNTLANLPQTMGVVVKPREKCFSGETGYVLYEANWGASLEKNYPQTLKDVFSLVWQSATALSCLHQAGYLHMDLKPENLLWVDRRQVKFFDFDACINMKELSRVHSVRCAGNTLQLLAPELRSDQSFEQNKYLYLNPKVDVYGLGCILFHALLGRWPEEADTKDGAFRQELQEFFARNHRKAFTKKQQEMMMNVVGKSIAHYVDDRYPSAEAMAGDLEKILAFMTTQQPPLDEEAQASYHMLCAYILDKAPLYPYVAGDEDDARKTVDAVIVGRTPLTETLFKTMFSCAQMLDTTLRIHLATAEPMEYLDHLLTVCPALGRVVKLLVNGERYEGDSRYCPNDESITAESYGTILFHTFDLSTHTPEQLLQVIGGHDGGNCPHYYLIAGEDCDRNVDFAQQLISFFQGEHQDTFIGYADDRGDGYDLRTLTPPEGSPVRSMAFSCSARISASEKSFKEEIIRKALKLHTYYTRQWAQRMPEREIRKSFQFSENAYNLRSSLRSALSIAYKLATVGVVDSTRPEAEFYDRVLTDTPQARTLREKLVYLEHRSWNCFMITDGWQPPTDQELTEYLFLDDKHDHRDKIRKLHPCICDSTWEGSKTLSSLNHGAWLSEHSKNRPHTGKPTMPYDPLDWMSLRLHAICESKVKHLNLQPLFDQLRDSMRIAGADEQCYDIADWLYTVYQRMLVGETNINGAWARACQDFGEAIAQLTDSVKRVFAGIREGMRVVVERNLFHDYKSSDETILHAIPMVLNPKPIRRIYKPISQKPWENMASALLTEAQELVLLTDGTEPMEDKTLAVWSRFFAGRGMERIKISQCRISEVRRIQITDQAVVDLTGAEPETVFAIQDSRVLSRLPVIVYRRGKLTSPTGYREIAWYDLPKSLSVEETFTMMNARVFSDKNIHSLMGLGGYAMHLWSAYLDVQRKQNSNYPWRLFTDLVSSEEEQKRYIPLGCTTPGSRNEMCTLWTSHRAIVDSGLDKVLKEMKREGLIETFTLPASDGKVWFITQYAELAGKLNKAIDLIRKEPYEHTFTFLKLSTAPITGKPLSAPQYYLKDDTLAFRATVRKESVNNLGGSSFDKDAAFKAVLDSLYHAGRNGSKANGCILGMGKDIPFVSETEDGKLLVQFRFSSFPIKECLMKEGNVLEAFAYHIIQRRALFDDVKPNVSFVWDSDEDDAHLRSGAIVNEVDMVCTKGLKTFFISCKQSDVRKEFLTEVKYYADYFGVDATAIILCSHYTTREDSAYLPQSFINRSKSMGVYFVGRSLVGDTPEDINSGKLARIIQNIVDEKPDWEEL